MTIVKWVSIEVGHVAVLADSNHQSLTKDQEEILKAIRCTARAAWSAGGVFDIPEAELAKDDWVAARLQQAVNAQLTANVKPVTIHAKHVIGLHESKAVVAGGEAKSSPEPGTHCRLRGDKWINVRSYWLHDVDGNHWLKDTLGANHRATATLIWECRTLGPCDSVGNAMPKP